jgi:hypothetical protein
MEHRRRLNLILLAVTGLLGLLIWQAQSPTIPPLTQLIPEAVEQIKITQLTGPQVTLHKRQGSWHSGSTRADDKRVAQFLAICRTPSLDNFAIPDDLRPFGLDPAPIQVHLNGLTLHIGGTDPINGWRYVRIDQRIHLIADGFYHHLTAAPESWQEHP